VNIFVILYDCLFDHLSLYVIYSTVYFIFGGIISMICAKSFRFFFFVFEEIYELKFCQFKTKKKNRIDFAQIIEIIPPNIKYTVE
jgi:hypothetical protein